MKTSGEITGAIWVIVIFGLIFCGVGLYETTTHHIDSSIPDTVSFCLTNKYDFVNSVKKGDVIVITTTGNSSDIELVQTISDEIRIDVVDEHTVEIRLEYEGDISGNIIVCDVVRNESKTIRVCTDVHKCSWLCGLFFDFKLF